jgi:hypothetical protein
MSATASQRVLLRDAARRQLGEAEGDTLMALLPPADTELATRQDVDGVRVEMSDLRTELQQEMSGLRTELQQEMSDLRTELRADMADLRTELQQEMSGLRTELRGDMKDLRSELHGDMKDLRSELRMDMASLEQRLGARMHRAQIWTAGLLLTTVLAGQGVTIGFLHLMLR